VSVGEVLSGVALAQKLKQAYAGRPLIVSTTTITGQTLARERVPFADAVIYFPLDWDVLCAPGPASRPSGDRSRARNGNLAQFLREAGKCKIPVIFVSGRRISDRSFERLSQLF